MYGKIFDNMFIEIYIDIRSVLYADCSDFKLTGNWRVEQISKRVDFEVSFTDKERVKDGKSFFFGQTYKIIDVRKVRWFSTSKFMIREKEQFIYNNC